MNRIYHPWWDWECYPAGFYENHPPKGMTAEECREEYRAFLSDLPRFRAALSRVITEWPNSCEHYLSNERMNRVAWLGQASLCIETGIPHQFRGGYMLLTDEEKRAADETALDALNTWLFLQREPSVDLDGAGVSAKVNLY